MKIKLSILLLSVAFVTMQACNSSAEKEENSNDTASEEVTESTLTVAERKAKLEKSRKELELQKKAELEELAKNSPYYELPDGSLVFYVVETEPSYMGGNEAMIQFLEDNLKYPEEAKSDDQEGTVFVDFILSDKGVVTNSEVTTYTYKNIDPAFVKEALRVVDMMPAWSPGLQNGKPVAVKYSIPITFRIN
ncbi:energy transducer TonB [Marivirga sp. S37H4]|uniref:Energy transducer TonB n=1 Tax=Marivirga aurantiaca TaxID=2802615 RepID=A0A934X0Z8_9BACT|nr:energy transducer TonB [Marivirga aurantiaca]MBK6266415.1 energy transducer TonB [Marivirga aurantiaca]